MAIGGVWEVGRVMCRRIDKNDGRTRKQNKAERDERVSETESGRVEREPRE